MSRPKRWAAALANATEALATLQTAFTELEELRDEYQDWRDNLPENLDQSPVAEKLDVIIELEFESSLDEVENQLNEAEGADLPLGFGRD